MKLELKHLAPYLPYGITMIHFKDDTRSVDLRSANISFLSKEFKPILRPLTDLANYREEGLINEHSINLLIESEYGIEYGMFSQYLGELELSIEGDPSQAYDSGKEIDFKVFQTIQDELLKGHYDIFGLIKKGLAIDINTLNK